LSKFLDMYEEESRMRVHYFLASAWGHTDLYEPMAFVEMLEIKCLRGREPVRLQN